MNASSAACSHADSIAAIATSPGAGGVGVVRLSGPAALEILKAMFRPSRPGPSCADGEYFRPRLLRHGHILDARGTMLDEVLAVYFPAPHSFTGEDVAEIQGHGGAAVLRAVLGEALRHGARLAHAGEFTRRAFLNGRMDLSQAEAVAELVAAPGEEGVRLAAAKLDGLLGKRVDALRDRLEYLRQRVCLAIDFPEEEAECLPPAEFLAVTREVASGARALLAGYQRARNWREGALVVLSGPVNAGKSSLMNALLGRKRAIVADTPGTTRDYLEESLTLDGLPVRLVDTAGMRAGMCAGMCDGMYADMCEDSADPIEREGMRLGRDLAKQAQAVLVLLDGERFARAQGQESGLAAFFAAELALVEELGPSRCLLVWNKADICRAPAGAAAALPAPLLEICARDGQGVDELAAAARLVCAASPPAPGELAPNARQARALENALRTLDALERDIEAGVPPDLCGLRLEEAAAHLGDVTGLNSAEETLNAVFADFCIGK